MYKYILETAGNINWMALLSLLTFMFIFITGVLLIFRNNKGHINYMANLPLESDGIVENKNLYNEV